MRETRPGPEPESEENTPVWSEKQGFFKSWVENKLGKEPETRDQSTETKEIKENLTYKPTKRWRRFFRRTFSSSVSKEDVLSNEHPGAINHFDASPLRNETLLSYEALDEPEENQQQPQVTSENFLQNSTHTETENNGNISNDKRLERSQTYGGYQGEIKIMHDTEENEEKAKVVTGGVAALTGLEYIGRKLADRKTRRKVERLSHETKELVDEDRQSKVIDSELPDHTRYLGQETELGKQNAERVLLHKEREVKPELVLEEVASAADRDLPLEKLYERRHEAKDRTDLAGVASVGAVIASMGKSIPQNIQTGNPTPTVSYPDSMAPTGQSAGGRRVGLYKQAVKAGFWSAIALIVLAAVVYFSL